MIIETIKYLIFGLIQGFTEPLPISSSGHLTLFRYLLNTDAFSDLAFESFLNFASFLAIFFIFRKDIIKLITSFFGYIFNKEMREKKDIQSDFKYCWLIVLGTIPAAVGGLLFEDLIEKSLGNNIKFLGLAFIITAILLYLVRKINGKKTSNKMTYKDAIIIGLFEMVALIPGISRSGAVLVGCLFRGLDKETALKYTFILYLPVSMGALILSFDDILATKPELIFPYIVGFISSLLVTYFASIWFFNIVKKNKLAKFSVYLLALGLVVLLFL